MKRKIVIMFILVIIGLVIGILLSTFVHIVLSRQIENIKDIFTVQTIVNSLLFNESHRNLFIIITLIEFLIITVMVCNPFKTNNTVKTVQITHNIQVPMRAGEGQYGQNWWLDKKEYNKKFGSNLLDPKNTTIQKILNNELINKNEQKIFDKGGLVIGHEYVKNKEKIYCIKDNVHTLTIGATRSGKR